MNRSFLLLKFDRFYLTYLLVLFMLVNWSCKRETQWEGQKPIEKVSTQTVPIQLQYKGTFDLGDGVFISNDFEGARLNGAARTNDTLLTLLITPENAPINMSPWYAFKIWSETERKTFLRLTYPDHAGQRYLPKTSPDGLTWEPLDSASFQVGEIRAGEESEVPRDITMKISIGRDTLWIAAQELFTSSHVERWIKELDAKSYVTRKSIGESQQGRPIHLLRIGESDDRKMILVVSRQHPPEISGFLAMQAFVETICSDIPLADSFRKNFNTYVVPFANPDGVDNGHWRHNYGGVDLNRDWADFNQPETSAIRDFMKKKTAEAGGKFYFAVDFHSTWEDIYYTIDPELKGNMPGLVPDMIEATARELPDYRPNIRPSTEGANVTSTKYFFYEFGAESLTYEIGDNTPRDFIHQKGEVAAMKLMELMLQ